MNRHSALPYVPCLLLYACVLVLPAASGQAPQKRPAPLVGADHAEKMTRGLEVFKKHVKPIFETKCLRCHGGKKIESDFDLSDREGLLKGGQIGMAVVPGKSKESQLVKLITHAKEPLMPASADKLPAEAIARIIEWIDLGAPYDHPLVASKLKGKTWTERVMPASARRFWAFEPLLNATPPRVQHPAWCRTPVDAFILSGLEQAGITPNAPATREQLIRRAYFDLIGLPPSPQEVQAFVTDTAPDAFARVVDRLLASPHYGERWGRHWLDLARFAESHGFEHDTDRLTAYHYRDFVIEALNQDLPYNTFVQWQIAGDEFAPNDPLALKATGFLAAGVHSTQITKNEVEKHRYDELDDKLNTISTAFLGLSVGCARCHDHKYDPIPQRDYYRMLATFTTTVRSEIDLALDQPDYDRAKAAFDRAHAPYEEALRKRERALRLELDSLLQTVIKQNLPWDQLEIQEAKSREGATLTVEEDGSILASGKNAKFDTYTIVARTSVDRIAAVRLEALAHPSMVKGGPGRAANGNFALSDFSVSLAPLISKQAANTAAVKLKLKNPRATFEQKGLPVKAVLDNDPRSSWAIDPEFGKDHAAAFAVDGPAGHEGGSLLTFTLQFNNNDGHNLGRVRLSASSAAAPELTAPGLPAAVRHLLLVPAAQRTEAQSTRLLEWARTLDPQWQQLQRQNQEHQRQAPRPTTVKALVATEGLAAVRLHTQGEDFFPQTYFLRRGDPANKEGVASMSFLQVLMSSPDAERHWQTPPPAGWRTSYRRRAFASWITDAEAGAGHLLARVIVNRLWQHHMARGLVTTPSDFGARGEPPTHPELLDYLAGELIKGGWRLKPIHKLIMTSAVYQQNTKIDEAKLKLDRENHRYGRYPTRRLEAEVIRDAILAVSGELDLKMFGPGTLDEKSKRRSIYFTIKRSKLMPMMVIFDAPEALSGMAERPTTTIAPQALHLLNNPQVRAAAHSLGRRISPDPQTPLDEAVRQGYQTALARQPSAEELADGVAFIRQQMQTYPVPQRREAALADFCQVLLCLNEFIYVD